MLKDLQTHFSASKNNTVAKQVWRKNSKDPFYFIKKVDSCKFMQNIALSRCQKMKLFAFKMGTIVVSSPKYIVLAAKKG